MATSAFKSTTKRTSLGDSTAARRSRSLSRVEENPAPRGKFVNTVRGSGFPEITLDDLSIQLSGHKSGGRLESRNDEVDSSSCGRGRSVSRRAGDGNNCGNGRVNAESASRRRRSVSVVRYQQEVSDSESDLDHSNNWKGRGSTKNGNSHGKVLDKTATPNHRPGLRRSFSQKDLKYHDGYSSHSSALTDDEARDAYNGRHGTERTIRTVYTTKKADHPTADDTSRGLYEAMRKELRNAVEEIRTELEQTRGTTASDDYGKKYRNSDAHQAVSTVTSFARKMEQFEKHKHKLIAEVLLEEQHGRKLSKAVKKLLPDSNNAAAEKPSRVRKKSSDRTRMSKCLTEEAERYFEDFISNVEDTDISSLDGERSDTSSTLGGVIKTENFQSPIIFKSPPVEMDGVVLPWLQWETSNDTSPFSYNNPALAMTPKTKLRSASEVATAIQDLSYHSVSSHGSWSPSIMDGHSTNVGKVAGSRFMDLDSHSSETSTDGSHFDVDEYLNRQSVEAFLHERWRQQQRIYSGSLLLCNQMPFTCYPSF